MNGLKIIIIEDDKIILKALSEHLEEKGFTIIEALDGEEGLEKIKDDKPDLVLLDILMPKIDGFGVLKKLKEDERTKKIPVVILSNLGQEEERKEGLKMGADDYLIKSNMDLDEISDKIKNFLS
jgi:DNA-binding response OmpR family regulator